MEPIRVGVIGAGGNTRQKHIPGLQAIQGVEVAMVCNRSLESSQRVADEFGIASVAEHWTDVVDDAHLDAVVIGTWPYTHCVMSCEALRNGKHVMVEARMAMNAAEAREMFETAKQFPEQVAQVVPSPFTLNVDKTVQRLLAEGYIGDLLAIDVKHTTGFVDTEAPISWRQETSKSGLNIMAMGILYEALMRWVGPAKRVSAMTHTVVKQRKNEAGYLHAIDVPDHVNIAADMVCGAQAHFQFSGVCGLAGTNGFWLYGSEGTLHIPLGTGEILAGKRGDDALSPLAVPDAEKGAWRVEEEFVNAIRGVEPITHTNFEDGVKYMDFTEAVHLSAARGEVVSLPLLG